MNKIISSYPNKYFKSKHKRFKNHIICSCKCDCDFIITWGNPPLKKGDICYVCSEGDHANPVYKVGKI